MSDSVIDAASGPGDGVLQSTGSKLQSLMSVTAEVVTSWSSRSAEKARGIQAAAEAADRDNRERIKALRDADVPVMRQVLNPRWWEQMTTEPGGLEDVGLVWETIGGWARNGDAEARRLQGRLRHLIKDRFDVQMPEEPVTGALAAELLTAPDAQRPVVFVIHDTETGSALVRETINFDSDDQRPLDVVAADRLTEFVATRGGESGAFLIEASDRSSTGKDRVVRVRDAEAAQVLADYRAFSQQVMAGERHAPLDQVRDVYLVERFRLTGELERLRGADPRLAAARETLADEVALRKGQRDPRTQAASPAGERTSVQEHEAKVAEVTTRLQEVQLRLDEVTADLNGELVGQVREAIVLRREMDAHWWQSAAPEEVAGVWTIVNGWADGAAKDGMVADLQRRVSETFGVALEPQASFETVTRSLHQVRASRRGERLVRFRVEAPGVAGPGETTQAASKVHADGTMRISAMESPQQAAQRQLATYAAGQPDGARLVITLTDREGAPLGTFNGAGPIVGPGTQERDTARPQQQTNGSTGHTQGGEPDPVAVDAGHLLAAVDAEQNLAERDLRRAEDALKRIAQSAPDGAEAAEAATRSRRAWPPGQLPVKNALRHGNARRRALGSSRPRSTQRLLHPRRDEPGR